MEIGRKKFIKGFWNKKLKKGKEESWKTSNEKIAAEKKNGDVDSILFQNV